MKSSGASEARAHQRAIGQEGDHGEGKLAEPERLRLPTRDVNEARLWGKTLAVVSKNLAEILCKTSPRY